LEPISDYRAFYGNFVVAKAGSSDEKLVAAFSSIRREDFLIGPPWSVLAHNRYISTDDPRQLYVDAAVGLAIERKINNGQPSLHALCMAACAPAVGNTIVHIGAGTGYYTAILATLAGPTGRVIAYEIEADFAVRACANLQEFPTVKVEHASATEGALPNADVIYSSAGATHPPASWLDALNVGGRLIFPMTAEKGAGLMLLVTRRSGESYAARVVSGAFFVDCIGARDDAASKALAAAMKSRAIVATKSLHRGTDPDATACCVGNGWWLSSAEPV
jgi:protein-L-isoaspartate(D-aspartate) O-methyltransferase